MDTSTLIERRVAALFRERLHVDVGAAGANLFDSGALDSLRLVDLLLHLERDFGVALSFDDVELERFQSVASIAAFLAGRGAVGAPGRTDALAAVSRTPA